MNGFRVCLSFHGLCHHLVGVTGAHCVITLWGVTGAHLYHYLMGWLEHTVSSPYGGGVTGAQNYCHMRWFRIASYTIMFLPGIYILSEQYTLWGFVCVSHNEVHTHTLCITICLIYCMSMLP